MLLSLSKKFPLKVEADVAKKLSMYVKAGLSLPEALNILEGQFKSKRYIQTILAWRMVVENGRTLAQAFEVSDMYKSNLLSVSEVTRLAVGLGDKSGSLGDSLLRASHNLNKKIALRKRIVNASAYPAAILVGTLGLVFGLIVFIFPKIIPLFESLKVTLPISTRIIIGLSRLVSGYWHVALIFLFVLGFVSFFLKRFSFCRQWVQYLMLRLPLVGKIIRLRQVSGIFDSLETLVGGGEQLSEALKTISRISQFYEYKNFLIAANEEVSQGRSFALFIENNKKLFPPYISSLVSTGERTANIEHAISDTAEIVQSELDDLLKALTVIIEPALMVSMSLIIGFIALSIILPIYGITSHFQN